MIKWILFGHLIKEADEIPKRASDIAPKIIKRPETKDGYLQYYEDGFQLRMNLKEGANSVGSSRKADCVVASNIADKHAVITRNGESYSIKNVSSEGKTYVNGVLLSKDDEKPIQAGAVILLNGFQMQFLRHAKLN